MSRRPSASLAVLAVLLALPGVARARGPGRAAWRPPLPSTAEVIGSFTFAARAPYAAGARRGVDLRARPGAPVVAVCSGSVAFAGAVPRWRGVTLACGDLRATELGLGTVTVRAGSRVRAGALVGRLGRAGVLRLGARRAARRHGYLDPLDLLAAPRPTGAPPAGPAPRRRPPTPARRRPAPPGPVRRAPVPVLAWPALALVSIGAAGARTTRRRRAHIARRRTSLAHRYR